MSNDNQEEKKYWIDGHSYMTDNTLIGYHDEYGQYQKKALRDIRELGIKMHSGIPVRYEINNLLYSNNILIKHIFPDKSNYSISSEVSKKADKEDDS